MGCCLHCVLLGFYFSQLGFVCFVCGFDDLDLLLPGRLEFCFRWLDCFPIVMRFFYGFFSILLCASAVRQVGVQHALCGVLVGFLHAFRKVWIGVR